MARGNGKGARPRAGRRAAGDCRARKGPAAQILPGLGRIEPAVTLTDDRLTSPDSGPISAGLDTAFRLVCTPPRTMPNGLFLEEDERESWFSRSAKPRS